MTAQAFIQWKGTDVCCDFQCECGHYSHIDAEFMYYVHCPVCGAYWESPSHILFRRVSAFDAGEQVVEAVGYD